MERVQFIQSALPRLLGFGRRRGNVLDFIVLIGRKVLIGGFTEEGVPVGAVEVGEFGWICHNSGEPIIERHMELRSDGAGLEIQDKRDRARVPIAHPHIHVALRSRFPSRNLLAAGDTVIEDVDRTAPHMEIPEFGLRPARPRKDVDRRETVLLGGHAVPNIDRMADGHRPEL
jgi:hypothetical protein